jgi:hypothetical protein
MLRSALIKRTEDAVALYSATRLQKIRGAGGRKSKKQDVAKGLHSASPANSRVPQIKNGHNVHSYSDERLICRVIALCGVLASAHSI